MAPSHPYSKELETARELAHRAGQAIMDYYDRDFAIDYKDSANSDPVTEADKHANEIIVTGLRKAFPDDGILAEESPPNESRWTKERLWCVDPLDGTREFIDHNGMFVVMIGLAIKGEARFGVVYQPTENRLFWGTGTSAFIEDKDGTRPLQLSSKENTEESTMVVSRSHRSSSVTEVADRLGVKNEKPMGSVGLKVAAIASGEAEIYLSMSNRTHEWDACAPEAIIRAAGGLMTDTLGQPLRYNKKTTETPRGMLATSGPLHQACVGALQPQTDQKGW
ncbi:3'(2'),5'-bisphosphate nucleotidase CysQ [Myxococcota bacterium]|nr:3'(2'),5'-bisphosphate nucleotidase CysQ [Myxococcota bacterium]